MSTTTEFRKLIKALKTKKNLFENQDEILKNKTNDTKTLNDEDLDILKANVLNAQDKYSNAENSKKNNLNVEISLSIDEQISSNSENFRTVILSIHVFNSYNIKKISNIEKVTDDIDEYRNKIEDEVIKDMPNPSIREEGHDIPPDNISIINSWLTLTWRNPE